MLQNEVALAICSVDRIQIRLVEDVLRCLTPRVRSVLVEAPDVRLLPGRCVWVAPRLQVALRHEVLSLVARHLGATFHSYSGRSSPWWPASTRSGLPKVGGMQS